MELVISKNSIKKVVNDVAAILNQKFKDQNVVIVPILKGAVYFCVDLTRKLTIPYTLYFVEAKSYSDNEIQKNVELVTPIDPTFIKNKTVILIDELYDNGKTLNFVKDQLLLYTDQVYTCVAFKKDKPSDYPCPDLVGCDGVPDKWLVGYGLDDNQGKRGLYGVYALIK